MGTLWRRLRTLLGRRRRPLAPSTGANPAPLRGTGCGTRYVYPSPAPSWQEMLGE
jgi:hypothetical protein